MLEGSHALATPSRWVAQPVVFGGQRHRARQEAVLADARLDVVCLLEVDPKDIERFADAAGFSWWRCSLAADVSGRHIAVAIVENSRVTALASVQLSVDERSSPVPLGLCCFD